MTRYKLFREIFLQKGFYVFKLSIFVQKLSNLSVFQSSFTSNSFRIRNEFFRIRILHKFSDPTRSRSTTVVKVQYLNFSHKNKCVEQVYYEYRDKFIKDRKVLRSTV